MANNRALTIDITTRDAQTLAALKRVQKELRDTGSTAERTSRQGLGLGDVLGGIAIGAGISKAISEFEDAEVTARKTAAAIESTGNAAGVSAQQQEELVESLSRVAAVDDEVVAGGANMLRTFTEIKGARFGETLAASMDVAAAKNIDLTASTQMLGKALQDPFEGYKKLQRVMGPLSDAAVQQIADFERVNDVAGAQGVILGELEAKFGGQAEAAATDSAKMRIAFDDAAESLGAALAPALSAAAGAAQRASSAFQGLPQPVQQVAIAGGALALVGPRIVETFGQIATSAGKAGTALRGSVADFGVAKGAALAGVAGLTAYATAYEYLEGKWKSGIDTSNLQEDLALFGKGQSDGQRILDEYGGSIDTLAGKIATLADAYENSGWENLSKGSNTDFGNLHQIKKEVADLDTALESLAKSDPDVAADSYERWVDALTGAGVAVDDIATVFPRYNAQVDRATEANTKGAGAAGDHADAQGELGEAVETTAEKMARQVDESTALYNAMEAVDQAGRDVNDAVIAVAEAQDQVAVAERGVADAQAEVAAAQERVADARRGVAAAEESLADARKGVEAATRGVAEAEKDAAEAREDVVDATEALATAQREAAGDSDAMRDALREVDDAETAFRQSQEDSLTAQEALTAAREGYGQTMRDLATDVAAATDDVTLAEIAIRDALARQAEVNADPEATADERKKAEIAVREARRRLEEIQRRLAEAQATYDRNNAGVDTSDAVVEAQDAVTAAADAQADAQERLEGAVQNVADTQVAANDAVADAQDNLAQAIDRRAQADQRVIDARDAVIDANNRVRDAAWGVEQANRNVASAVDGVRDAQQRVVDAKDAVVEARHAVRDAEREVTEKLIDQATKQYELDLKTQGASKATQIFKQRLDEIGAALDPNTPTARNLAAYAALIGFVTSTYPSAAAAIAALGASAPPGAQNAERQGRSNTRVAKTGPAVSDHGPAGDKDGAAPAAVPPAARADGWVQQPNGRWWHPRRPGEEDYGDGYSDSGPPLELLEAVREMVTVQAREAEAAQAERERREVEAERRGKAGDKPASDAQVVNNYLDVDINFPDVTDPHTAAVLTDRYLATSLNPRARAA